jgi:hypothetical protein
MIWIVSMSAAERKDEKLERLHHIAKVEVIESVRTVTSQGSCQTGRAIQRSSTVPSPPNNDGQQSKLEDVCAWKTGKDS